MRLSAAFHDDDKWSIALWAVVESTTGICVASAPALRPLVFRTGFVTTRNPHSRDRTAFPSSSNGSRGREIYNLERVKITKTVQVTTTCLPDGDNSTSSTTLERDGQPVGTQEGGIARFEASVRAGTSSVYRHSLESV
jgi:hypothetical protein